MNTSPNNFHNQPAPRGHWSRLAATLLVSLALLVPGLATAGSVAGVLKDEQGKRVNKAKVCVFKNASDVAALKCFRIGKSARSGKFVLPNLKKGTYYLSVQRPADKGPDAAWLPELRKADLKKNSSVVKTLDFTLVTKADADGFRNFRNDMTLTAANFPELAGIVGSGKFAVLQVTIPGTNGAEDEVLFLGKITSDDLKSLAIPLSIPRGVTTLAYQIFNSEKAVSGTLQLPKEQ